MASYNIAMKFTKPIYLVICLIGAASLFAIPSLGAPSHASSASSDYTEKYLRCYEYSYKSSDHSDADYNFKYGDKWYYCWNYDKKDSSSSNGGY